VTREFYGCSSCDRHVSSLLTDTCEFYLDVSHTLVAMFTIVPLYFVTYLLRTRKH
jgi:hypothetical protein